MSASNVVFDTSKVYTERDTRTRRVFIIGVRLLRSRDERRTKERGRTMLREREDQRLQELGDFLRTRRARLAPEDVGLPRGSRRRAPGLRRAEVAQLAGVSVDWYTWLEQGRPITVSTQVLESLVQALHLNANEREHLFFLAHQQPPPERAMEPETVSATLQHFLDHQGQSSLCLRTTMGCCGLERSCPRCLWRFWPDDHPRTQCRLAHLHLTNTSATACRLGRKCATALSTIPCQLWSLSW